MKLEGLKDLALLSVHLDARMRDDALELGMTKKEEFTFYERMWSVGPKGPSQFILLESPFYSIDYHLGPKGPT